MSTRAKVLIGVGVGVLLAVVAGVLWFTGVFDSVGTSPEVEITTAGAHRTGSTLPTGVRIDFDASYDKSAGHTVLDVEVSAAPNAPVRGELLLVLPGLEGAGCAQVAEEDDVVAPVRASADGLSIDCGYKLTDVSLAAGESTTIALAVDLELVDDKGGVPEDYSAWLETVSTGTDTALTAITGTSFPLQRVTGIRVEPTSITLAEAATPVPYRVAATWSGGDLDSATELFTSETVDGMEVELLQQLTGGLGLDGVTVSACNAAQVIGIRVLAEQPENNCQVRVRVGMLDSGEASFGIRMR